MAIELFETYSDILGETNGSTVDERLLSCKKLFVRSQDGIALSNPLAKGRLLTAWEVYYSFPIDFWDIIGAIREYGSSIVVADKNEPARSLKNKRENILGVSVNTLSRYSGVSIEDIMDAENPKTRTPVRVIEGLCRCLDLYDESVSSLAKDEGDKTLAVRTKTYQESSDITESDVLAFSEAAWVIRNQNRFVEWLKEDFHCSMDKFEPDDNYGSGYRKPWAVGYELAHKTREILDIPQGDPVDVLDLVEDKMGIPVIHAKLSSHVAGATVAAYSKRGIILNTLGANQNSLVRRVTLAHELGHLLWDPDQRLENIAIDNYLSFDRSPSTIADPVEQRANAFAIELLAPSQRLADIVEGEAGFAKAVRKVMDEFGVSFTSAYFHMLHNKNKLNIEVPEDVFGLGVDTDPSDKWRINLDYYLDYYPCGDNASILRRGRFTRYVAKACKNGFISMDTAAAYLMCSPESFESAIDDFVEW